MNEILIPISPGELLDKITILEIKNERMTEPAKLVNVRTELDLLRDTWAKAVTEDDRDDVALGGSPTSISRLPSCKDCSGTT